MYTEICNKSKLSNIESCEIFSEHLVTEIYQDTSTVALVSDRRM